MDFPLLCFETIHMTESLNIVVAYQFSKCKFSTDFPPNRSDVEVEKLFAEKVPPVKYENQIMWIQ
jgi:hypothetical protein